MQVARKVLNSMYQEHGIGPGIIGDIVSNMYVEKSLFSQFEHQLVRLGIVACMRLSSLSTRSIGDGRNRQSRSSRQPRTSLSIFLSYMLD